MPELPEVETIARGVHTRVRNDRITDVWFSSHRQPFKNPPAHQAKGLEGRTILGVERVGKHIVMRLGVVAQPSSEGLRREARLRPAGPKSLLHAMAVSYTHLTLPTTPYV